MSLLSIVIPIYNEQATLEPIVRQVQSVNFPPGWKIELILVDDASSDTTPKIISKLNKEFTNISNLKNERNLGKTQTVKQGILKSQGDFVIVQDADLEYDPREISEMLQKAINENLDVIYGNRFGHRNKVIYWQNFIGNKFVSLVSNLFTYPRIGTWIPDMETCYKLIKGDVARDIATQITATSNFGFEPEVTARLARFHRSGEHLRFGILPIHYNPRTVSEGKKIKVLRDGTKAVCEVIYYNLF
ncbi:MAG: glycosyltransferase family 2 protein [Candidatus Doudnabacteria bacterium]|nr:glycosyltransferase family 2 protein [Candidatus Doudnabacteria bacterium]